MKAGSFFAFLLSFHHHFQQGKKISTLQTYPKYFIQSSLCIVQLVWTIATFLHLRTFAKLSWLQLNWSTPHSCLCHQHLFHHKNLISQILVSYAYSQEIQLISLLILFFVESWHFIASQFSSLISGVEQRFNVWSYSHFVQRCLPY